MLDIHRWLQGSLLIMLGIVLAACSSRSTEPSEPLDLVQLIAVDQAGQEVQFEFEMNANNFMPYRTYAVELELQRKGAYADTDPDMRSLVLPFEISLRQWSEGAWRDIPTYDNYQARERNLGEALPAWHTSGEWQYAQLTMGSGGEYTLNLTSLPLETNTRYRVSARTVQAMPDLHQYAARIRVHAARQLGK